MGGRVDMRNQIGTETKNTGPRKEAVAQAVILMT